MLLLFLLSSCTPDNRIPSVADGILSLKDVDIDRRIRLNGEWKFTFNEFLDPGTAFDSSLTTITVPEIWNNKADGYPAEGIATYVLKIKAPSEPITLEIGYVSTAYSLFINGNLAVQKGFPGKTESENTPFWQPAIVDLPGAEEEYDLVFHVSNFGFRRGGINHRIYIGSRKYIDSYFTGKISEEFFITGTIMMMAILNIVFFLYRKQKIYSLFFALLCIITMIRTWITGYTFSSRIYTLLPWIFWLKLEYLTFIGGVTASFFYIYYFLPEGMRKIHKAVIWLPGLIFTLIILLTPPLFSSRVLILYQIYTITGICFGFHLVLAACRKKSEGSLMILFGGLFLGLCAINDMLYYNGISPIGPIAYYGMYLFIFFQSILISYFFTKSMETAENLSTKYKQSNMALLETQKEITSKNIELVHLAYFDYLTKLPNRRNLYKQLHREISQAERRKAKLAVLLLDLDGFKDVNDTFGHDAGDDLLGLVGERLQKIIRTGDLLFRPGSDEFAIILTDFEEILNAAVAGQKFIDQFKTPFLIKNKEVSITASAGISISPDNGTETARVLRNADLALTHSKENGKNCVSFFSNKMNEDLIQKVEIERDLRSAIEKEELTIHFQPQINPHDNSVYGFEVLTRWTHPEKGNIPPAKFIAVAEKSGLIIPLGEWILKESFKTVNEWINKGAGDISIGINLSAIQFRQENLTQIIRDLLNIYNIPPEFICFEITESTLMEEKSAAVEKLQKLKNLGVKISIDDFGTGYSSLSYLKNFPVDELKIDQSFIRDLYMDKHSDKIVMTIIQMAENLGLNIVAEGVETEKQLDFLNRNNCTVIQGFLFSRALPKDEAETFYEIRKPENTPSKP